MNSSLEYRETMTDEEYIEWAKSRALAYVASHDYQGAYCSLDRDLRHRYPPEIRNGEPPLANHPRLRYYFSHYLYGSLKSRDAITRVIEGFTAKRAV